MTGAGSDDRRLALVSLLVDDYDEAIAYFVDKLGFIVVEDTPMTPQKRWVVVAPPGGGGARLLLAKAKNDAERPRIGDQTGGRVFLFLHVADFDAAYAAMRARGVDFVEDPRDESYGKVVVFRDLYGNKWDMVERGA